MATARDGLGAAGADCCVQEHDAACAELPRAPGDAAAVVAVGGAGDGDEAGVVAACEEVGGAGGGAAAGELDQQDVGDGVGTAERLDAAEAEAVALVLEPNGADAGLGGQGREIVQRRLGVARPARDFRLGAAEAAGGEDDGAGSARVLVDEPVQRHGAEALPLPASSG